MHLLLAATPRDPSAALIAAVARARDISVTHLLYPEIAGCPVRQEWVRPETRAILRDPYRRGASHETAQRMLLGALPSEAVLDGNAMRRFPEYEDKLFQFRLFDPELPLPDTSPLAGTYGGPFPVVLKRRIASAGRGTFLVYSKNALEQRLHDQDPAHWLLQQYLDIDHDYRVLVLEGRVLGAVKRAPRVHEGDAGDRLAVKVHARVELPDEVLALALRATEIMGCDFAGVDIVASKSEHYLIECNLSPQYRSTQQVLGLDVTAKLLDLLQAKSA